MTRRGHNRGGGSFVRPPPNLTFTKFILPGDQGAKLSYKKRLPRGGSRIKRILTRRPNLNQTPVVLPGDRAAYYLRKRYAKTY